MRRRKVNFEEKILSQGFRQYDTEIDMQCMTEYTSIQYNTGLIQFSVDSI